MELKGAGPKLPGNRQAAKGQQQRTQAVVYVVAPLAGPPLCLGKQCRQLCNP